MKNLIIVITALCFSYGSSAQTGETIVAGKKEAIYSKVLNEHRKLWIYTPNITSLEAKADKRYPVVYILDGDAHFLSTVGIVQQLSQANGNGVLPEMIVVAIENTNRLRDLTPALPVSENLPKPNAFVHFMSTELFPYIDKNYPTTPYKVLIGHSLGGLLAIDILTNFPQLFNAFVAIDPSMWYDQEKYLNHAINQLPKQQLNGTRLFIGTANTLPSGISLSKVTTDRQPETQHIRSILKLDHFLNSNSNGLIYAQKFYEHENHNTVPLISVYDGLRFVYDYYSFNATQKDFADSTALIASKLKAHYTNISTQMGYQVAAPESFLNYLGYDALSKKQYKKAEALFKLNTEYYPNSRHVYDSYGDYFSALRDTANAVNCYKKALQIEVNSHTLGKLDALTKQESFRLTLDELQKYVGVYILETYQIAVVLELREGSLWSKVQGQADSEFLPVSKDVFTLKEKQGYTITFHMDGDKPLGFTSVQPNGTFRAVFKNE